MNRKAGFTLIEVVIAVAISASLVGAVYAALVSTTRTAHRQERDAGEDARRMRVIEILRADFRGRQELKVEGGSVTCQTTSDGLSPYWITRGTEVSYEVSENGLLRREGEGDAATEIILTQSPVVFQFLEKGIWREAGAEDPEAIRVIFDSPLEVVVIR